MAFVAILLITNYVIKYAHWKKLGPQHKFNTSESAWWLIALVSVGIQLGLCSLWAPGMFVIGLFQVILLIKSVMRFQEISQAIIRDCATSCHAFIEHKGARVAMIKNIPVMSLPKGGQYVRIKSNHV